jgi:serine/threonine protein phosphatase PrpC
LLTSSDDPQQIAQALVDGALEGGSRDNITSVVVIVD